MSTEELLHEGLVPTAGKRIRRSGLHSLTGIRFFAAIWVMAFHFGAGFSDRSHMPWHVTSFLRHGYLGVCLFFMLSGFILFYAYQGNLKTSRDLYKFFVARLARIYPVYLLATVLMALALRSLPHGHDWMVFSLVQSWTPAVSNSGYAWIMQAWTLSVEMFFYCCFPLLLFFFRRNRPPALLWSLAACFFVIGVALRSPTIHAGAVPGWLTNHILLPVICLPEFILGMLLGSLFLQRQQLKPEIVTKDWITAVGLLPWLAIIASGTSPYLVSAAALLCFGWAIYRLADGRGWLTTALSSPPLLLLGGASFSVYLLQGPMRMLVHLIFSRVHHGLDAALFPFILVGVCCLIYLYYEEPMRDHVRNLLTRRSPKIEA
ncbi:MAG TPA: acyltransferase [Acidobacteriaceae bacterium]